MELALARTALPWEDTLLIPLGDIQMQHDRDAIDIKGLKATVQYGVDHNALWLGMADFVDLESPSNRKAIQNSGVYDSVVSALDAAASEMEQEVLDILLPTKGRWLGFHEGHHFHVHSNGETSDQRFARELGGPFLGHSSYVNLTFQSPSAHHVNPVVTIWAHHGQGGGALAGSATNRLEKAILGFDADLYLMGHTHTRGAVPRDRVYASWGRDKGTLKHKTLYIVNCGSYLKAYQEESRRNGRPNGGYPEQAMMNPLALGSPHIWFKPAVDDHGQPIIRTRVEV